MREPPPGNGLLNGKNYILTAVLGSYQGKQYSLKANHETVIGRGDDADIIFDDHTVSRRHAKIFVQGEDVIVEDMGSTNGIFVDGRKITRSKVKLGDLIVIGSNMVNIGVQPSGPTMRVAAPGVEPAAGPVVRMAAPEGEAGPAVRIAATPGIGSTGPVIRIASAGLESAVRDSAASPRKVNGSASMSGQIDQIPLSDLIQLLSTSGKSGVLEVRHEEETGHFYVNNGQIEYAAIEDCPNMAPKKALYRMMLWKHGTFELLPPSHENFEPKITDPPDILLLEAMRQDDEYSRIPGDKPEMNTVLSVSGTLDKPFHTLSPNQLNMIQLILSHKKVRKILYHSPLPDYETYRMLIELIKEGFVKEEPEVTGNVALQVIKS